MSVIKYPNGIKIDEKTIIKNKTPKPRNLKKSRLGVNFEELINESNQYYLDKGLAAIYKKPTPIQVVSVDYPARNKARISEAYYKTPSTTDYNGIYRQCYIDFEAKSCKEMSFSFERIYLHQIKHLENIYNLGGISFLIVEFSTLKEVYILPTPLLIEKHAEALNGGRKSIPYEYFKEHAYLIKESYHPAIDYLKIVDQIYFDEHKFLKN